MKIFSYIKQHVHIFDVIREYTTLKAAGSYFKGRCPFHHEKTASFTVSPDKEIFYCFGCHAQGDVIAFIAKIENCGQLEAATLLAEKYAISIPQELAQQNGALEHKEQYYALYAIVRDWCKGQLHYNAGARSYLEARGMSSQMITHYGVGFFPSGQRYTQDLLEKLRKENILASDAIEAHIFRQGRTVLFSPFEDRIIFPITDRIGRVCGFGGRIYKSTDERVKYYNSQESSHFSKGSLLYGLEQAKKEIQETKKVFLVEGYTDCISMAQHGYQNTVATLGTACTSTHLTQLARYADKLYFVYDGDEAGTQAVLRIAQLCLEVDMEPYIIQLPKDDDPETFLSTHGTIDPLLSSAKDIFQFFIYMSGQSFATQSMAQKMKSIRGCILMISDIKNPIKQDLLLANASLVFDIPLESLKAELKGEAHKNNTFERSTEKNLGKNLLVPEEKSDEDGDALEPLPITLLDKRFLVVILKNPLLALKTEIQALFLQFTPPLNALFSSIVQLQREDQTADTQQLLMRMSSEHQKIASAILVECDQMDVDQESYVHVVEHVQKKVWKKVVNDIKIKLEYAKKQMDLGEISQLMNQLMEIQKSLLLLKPRQDENK